MFSGILERLNEDVQIIKNVLTIHDTMRREFYKSAEGRDPWSNLRAHDPTKSAWQIYDHCAAFTRLYAVYEQFVEDLVAEYLLLLPQLYERYDQLPLALLKQHRLGFGQILLKLGKEGPYRHLEEHVIIGQLSRSLKGESYTLLDDAFFVDRQNYRLDMIQKLFGTLGFDQVASRISKQAALVAFLDKERSEGQTVKSELEKFIQYRNEAAHTEVTEIISIDEFKSIADFIKILCKALLRMVKEEFVEKKLALGQFESLGRVSEVFRGGLIAIVRAKPCQISVGDEIAVCYSRGFTLQSISSLQLDNVPCPMVTLSEGVEVGIGVEEKIRRGAEIRRITPFVQQQSLGLESPEGCAEEDDLQRVLNEDVKINETMKQDLLDASS